MFVWFMAVLAFDPSFGFLMSAPQPAQNEKTEVTMTLGNFAEIDLAVGDLKAASAFIEKLGFAATAASTAGGQSAAFTDGNIVLVLHEEEFNSPRVTFWGSDIAALEKALGELGVNAKTLAEEDGASTRIAFETPSGLSIVADARQAAARPEVEFEWWNPSKLPTETKHFSKVGIFGEFALPVEDRVQSAEFFTKLGFQNLHESNGPYPWGIYGAKHFVFGVHQTKDFQAPGITFFSKDSAKRIGTLKEEGIEFKVEVDQNNAIFTMPEGVQFFLFGSP